jgi:hypothetical protein
MEIENLKSNHAWENIPCQKNESCYHCKCKKQYRSIPQNDFTISVKDEQGNLNQYTISKIKINYGKNDEVLGWFF